MTTMTTTITMEEEELIRGGKCDSANCDYNGLAILHRCRQQSWRQWQAKCVLLEGLMAMAGGWPPWDEVGKTKIMMPRRRRGRE
jgi:hypothetical protein